MGLAERADVIVDFTNVPVGDYVLGNLGPDEPFGGGEPPGDFDAVRSRLPPARSCSSAWCRRWPPIPRRRRSILKLPAITPLPTPVRTRPLALIEMMSNVHDGPSEAMLGRVDANGMAMHQEWMRAGDREPEGR